MFFRHVAAGLSGYVWLTPAGVCTLGGTAAAPAAAQNTADGFGAAKQVIFVMLAGAPSHVDMFDCKPASWTPREFAPEFFEGICFPQGLLPGLASQTADFALLRSVRSWAVVHGLSNQWIQIARNPVPASSRLAPHLGSVIAHELERRPEPGQIALPPFFSLNSSSGPGAGFLSAGDAPIFMQASGAGLSPETPFMDRLLYERRRDLLLRVEAAAGGETSDPKRGVAAAEAALFASTARSMLFDANVDGLFRFRADESTRYGESAFGNACLVARNLVEADKGVRFVEITFPGWDSHGLIYRTLPSMAKQLDAGLSALLDDLRASGGLARTLVVAMGEFGRTPGPLNSAAGRDHFPQHAVWMAGAGIRGNLAIGETDELGAATIDPGWSADRDIRPEDIAATIYHALGVDWRKSVRTPDGLRFDYVPQPQPGVDSAIAYRPVEELWRR